MSSLLQSPNLQIMRKQLNIIVRSIVKVLNVILNVVSDEELIKQVPKNFIIPSSQLQLVHNQTIGQGSCPIPILYV